MAEAEAQALSDRLPFDRSAGSVIGSPNSARNNLTISVSWAHSESATYSALASVVGIATRLCLCEAHDTGVPLQKASQPVRDSRSLRSPEKSDSQ